MIAVITPSEIEELVPRHENIMAVWSVISRRRKTIKPRFTDKEKINLEIYAELQNDKPWASDANSRAVAYRVSMIAFLARFNRSG